MNDPFKIEPQLWFGVLCHGVQVDQLGQITIQAVFNQVAYFTPPQQTEVPPNAFLHGLLTVGFTGGLGHFEAVVEIRDIDDITLWQRPEPWVFDIGPGQPSAILAEQVNYWFRQPGQYHFWIRPYVVEHRIPFEVAAQIGPAARAAEEPQEDGGQGGPT